MAAESRFIMSILAYLCKFRRSLFDPSQTTTKHPTSAMAAASPNCTPYAYRTHAGAEIDLLIDGNTLSKRLSPLVLPTYSSRAPCEPRRTSCSVVPSGFR